MARNPGKQADTGADRTGAADKALDAQGLSAAIAGFMACQVLLCRFLAQEGVVDRDRLVRFLESALAEMQTGIDDPRALFGLQQLIHGMQGPAGGAGEEGTSQ